MLHDRRNKILDVLFILSLSRTVYSHDVQNFVNVAVYVPQIEQYTQHSYMVRRMVIQAGAIPILLQELRSANRSSLYQYLVHHVFGVLLHLLQSPCCIQHLYKQTMLPSVLCEYLKV